jgi:hypothetical protein
MIRHGLLIIHPAKKAWQETKAYALNGSHTAAVHQKGSNIHRPGCVFRTECLPFGRCASYTTDGRATQRNGTNPKFP